MSLRALLLCSDEKIVRVLRRILGDLDMDLELCAHADSALYRLTRRRFEGIIVDCEAEGASQVLRSARSAPCNRQAVAVAIVQPVTGLREVFSLGAHFVLYKPVSSERAKASFRAARALMKRERRDRVSWNRPRATLSPAFRSKAGRENPPASRRDSRRVCWASRDGSTTWPWNKDGLGDGNVAGRWAGVRGGGNACGPTSSPMASR